MNNVTITIEAVDAIGYVEEGNLQELQNMLYMDKSNGDLFIQQAESVLKIVVGKK